jgi:hypothetical protein
MDTPTQIPQGYQPPAEGTTAAAPAPAPPTTAAPPVFAPPAQTATPSFLAPTPPPTAAPFTPGQTTATAYHPNVQRGGFDDEVTTGDYASYKGVKGRTDRIGFLASRDLAWGRTHYVEKGDMKGFFLCDSVFEKAGGQEVAKHLAACCQKLGPPKKRFAATVIHYTTNDKGVVIHPFSYSLKVWRINEILFDQIRTLGREHPLEQCDIWAKCTDDQYWKYELTPLRESIIRHPDFRASLDPSGSGQTNGQIIDAYVAAMAPRLDRMTGKAATPAEWAEIIGVAGGFSGAPGGQFPGTVVGGLNDQPVATIAQLLRPGS